MPLPQFNEALRDAELTEQDAVPLVEQLLVRYGLGHYKYCSKQEYPAQYTNLKSQDLVFSDGEKFLLIEVKDNKSSQRTGNVAFEYECSGKPSCLAVTESPLWVVRYFDTTWKFQVVLTSRLLQEWKSEKYRSVKMGDKDNTGTPRAVGFLVPVSEFKTWGLTLGN